MMSVEEILNCEIPEGDYKLGMIELCRLISGYSYADNHDTNLGKNPEKTRSLVACFSALMELANGRDLEFMKMNRELGRQQAIRDVLEVVDKMEAELHCDSECRYANCKDCPQYILEINRNELENRIQKLGEDGK